MWLERRDGEFEIITAVGPLQEPLVRTVIAGQSDRLMEAATRTSTSPSRGKAGEPVRKLHLSPVTIGGEMRAPLPSKGRSTKK